MAILPVSGSFNQSRGFGEYSCSFDGRQFYTAQDLEDHKYNDHYRYHGF